MLYPSLHKSWASLVECVEIPVSSADLWTIAHQIQFDAVNIAWWTVFGSMAVQASCQSNIRWWRKCYQYLNTHIFFTNVKNHSCLSMKGDPKSFFLFLFIYPVFPEIQGVHSVCNSPAVPASRRVWISGVLHKSQRPIIFLLHCVHGTVYPNISFSIMLDNKQSRSMSVYSCRPNGVHPNLTRKFGVPPHCRQHRKSSLSHKVFYQAVSKVIAIMGLPAIL
jgi:hypothetical protein